MCHTQFWRVAATERTSSLSSNSIGYNTRQPGFVDLATYASHAFLLSHILYLATMYYSDLSTMDIHEYGNHTYSLVEAHRSSRWKFPFNHQANADLQRREVPVEVCLVSGEVRKTKSVGAESYRNQSQERPEANVHQCGVIV